MTTIGEEHYQNIPNIIIIIIIDIDIVKKDKEVNKI